MKKCLSVLALLALSLNLYAFVPVAKIIAVKGKGKVNDEVARVGLEVAEGNKIQLKRGERVTIEFQNGHKVSLNNASVVFEVLNPKNTLANLERGTMFVDIKTLSQNENFNVRANNVQVAASASLFLMDNNGKKIRLTVGSGQIQAQRLKETMELTSLEEAVFDKSPRFEKKKVKESQFKRARKVFN